MIGTSPKTEALYDNGGQKRKKQTKKEQGEKGHVPHRCWLGNASTTDFDGKSFLGFKEIYGVGLIDYAQEQ